MLLNEIREFQTTEHVQWQERLFALNIRHVEQLGSLLAAPEGRYALEKLGVPLNAVQKSIEPVLQNRFGLSLSQPLKEGSVQKIPLLTLVHYSMGYNAGERDPFRTAVFDTALPDPPGRPEAGTPEAPDSSMEENLPSEITLGGSNPLTAADQGRRGTCVAFSVMGMYQLMLVRASRHPARLSPQYLYFRAKFEDNLDIDEEGTSLDAALGVLKTQGCCLDHHLEYRPKHDITQAYRVRGYSAGKSESDLKKLAKGYRITRYRSVEHTVEAVKKELAEKRPVGVGLGVYQLAWYNTFARSSGEIALPPMDTDSPQITILDNYLGGHAVVLIGYRDNSTEPNRDLHRPGGGYFVFRNSWGEGWAAKNDFASGYGYLPYEYFRRFCLEAAVIDEIPPLPRLKAAAGKPVVKAKPRSVAKTQPEGGEKPVVAPKKKE